MGRLPILDISLPRTGTRSVAAALRKMGLRTIFYWDPVFDALVERRRVNAPCDAVVHGVPVYDVPCLAHLYPEATFLHRTRPLDSWLDSWARNQARRPWRLRKLSRFHVYLFGRVNFDPALWTAVWKADQLRLETWLRAGFNVKVHELSWSSLSEAVGLTPPDEPFPHIMSVSSRKLRGRHKNVDQAEVSS